MNYLGDAYNAYYNTPTRTIDPNIPYYEALFKGIDIYAGIRKDGATPIQGDPVLDTIATLGIPSLIKAGIGVVGRFGLRTAEEALFSRIVPGGGLAAHEAAGGHLLLKHVGQTESQLMARLAAEPGITGASSFSSRAAAENAVSGALDANASNISRWLSGSSGRLRIDYTASNPVGISVARGTSGAVEVNSKRIILVRDPKLPTGYRIQTGFPTKP